MIVYLFTHYLLWQLNRIGLGYMSKRILSDLLLTNKVTEKVSIKVTAPKSGTKNRNNKTQSQNRHSDIHLSPVNRIELIKVNDSRIYLV